MIHPSAPPNHLAPDELRVRPGTAGVTLGIDPERAGWRYLGFRTLSLEAGARIDIGGLGTEQALVVISGGGVSVDRDSVGSLELAGRRTVFDRKPWAVYV